MRHSKKMPNLPALIEVVLKRKEKKHPTFAVKHSRKSDVQQTSYPTAVAEIDLRSIDDIEVLENAFSSKIADHLRQLTASMAQP